MLTPQKGANQNQKRCSQLERLFEQFRPFPNIVRRRDVGDGDVRDKAPASLSAEMAFAHSLSHSRAGIIS